MASHGSQTETPTRPASSFRLGDWEIDPDTGTVRRGGVTRRLEPKVMEVLVCLADRPGRVVPKDELLQAVWPGAALEEGALSRAVYRIRRALDDDARAPRYIETLARRGYRLAIVPEDPVAEPSIRPTNDRLGGRWVLAMSVVFLLLATLLGLHFGRMTGARSADPLPQRDHGGSDDRDALTAYSLGLERAEHFHQGDRLVAVTMFERAVELDPQFALAWAELARQHLTIYRDGGSERTAERLEQGHTAARHALTLTPDLPQAHAALGLYYHAGFRDYERALDAWTQALVGLPDDPDLLVAAGGALRRLGRFEEALELHQKAARVAPESALASWELGNTLQSLGHFDGAIERFDQALTLQPGHSLYAASRIHAVLLAHGDLDRALELSRDILPSADAWALDTRLWVAWLRGETVPGLRLLAASPRLLEHQFAITPKVVWQARLRERGGEHDLARADWNDAVPLLREELRRRPADHRLHSALAESLAARGEHEGARYHAHRAITLHPESEDALTGPLPKLAAARVHLRLAEPEAALDLVIEVLSAPSGLFLSPALLRIDPAFAPLLEVESFRDRFGNATAPEVAAARVP